MSKPWIAVVMALAATPSFASDDYAKRVTDARNVLLDVSVGKFPENRGDFEVFCQVAASYSDFVVCAVLNKSNEPVGTIPVSRGWLSPDKALDLVNRCAMPENNPSCNILIRATLNENNDLLFKDFEVAKDYPYKFL